MRASEFVFESYDWDWRELSNQHSAFNQGYKPQFEWPPSEQEIKEIERRVLQDPEWLSYYKRFGWDSWTSVPQNQVFFNKHDKTVTFYDVPAITKEWNPQKEYGIVPDRALVKIDLNENFLYNSEHAILLPRAVDLIKHYVKSTFTSQNLKYMTERYYVRFGRWHNDERSQNWLATKEQGRPVFEKGVSAYHAEWNPDEQRWAIADGINEDTITGTLASLLYNPEKKLFLVQGTELKEDGADGEPLLRNVKLIKSLKVTDVYVPGIYDPREENLMEDTQGITDKIQNKLGLKTFIVYERGQDLVLDSIIVGKENQGKGFGSQAIKMLTDYADKNGKRIILTPGTHDPHHGTTSRSRLIKFYKRFGFRENKGRNIDYAVGGGKMIRDPKLSETAIKLRGFGPSEKTRDWVAKIKTMFYSEGPNNYMFWNHEGNLIPHGKENSKDIASFVQFELVPKQQNKVEVKWIQATPMRSGRGSQAMKILQELAQKDGIALTLFPWDKGQISQSKLIKFYKKQGFVPVGNSKNMIWEPK